MTNSVIYQEGCWRVCQDDRDRITVQSRTLGVWTTWTELAGHETWLTVVYPDYETAISFIQRML